MPHWFGCFAEKKTIFKDFKDSSKGTKSGNGSNRNCDKLLWDSNQFYVHQRHLVAWKREILNFLKNANSSLCDRTLFSKTQYAIHKVILSWDCLLQNRPVCSNAYGCHIDTTLVFASTRCLFTIFIVMSGLFLLVSAIVRYQHKINLFNLMKGERKQS